MSFATFEDHAKLDRMIAPPAAPERIHGWVNSQLSISRFMGGCTVYGCRYVINYDEPGHPLVRSDVLAREKVARMKETKAAKVQAKQMQEDLL